jgi:hypothetical protein
VSGSRRRSCAFHRIYELSGGKRIARIEDIISRKASTAISENYKNVDGFNKSTQKKY